MNKKLIALAVAGACVAPTVMAQTANPVTLYGRIYVTVESVEADGPTAATQSLGNRSRIQDQASYLGVRGTEDLGGGLKAVFQLETSFAPDQNPAVTGTPNATTPRETGFANRNSMVGLQGSWGTIFAGRWDTPMKQVITATDPWGDLTIADVNGVTMDQGNFSRRQNNSLQYWSPKFMGALDLKLMATSNEGKTASANPSGYGASLTWNKGPLYLTYAYEQHKDGLPGGAPGASTPNYKEEGNAIGAIWRFGNARLLGSYGEYKKTGGVKDKSYHVGGDWKINGGKHNLIGTYMNAEEGAGDCDAYSVGYKYDFSRRTFFITSYTEIDNSNGMNCNFGTGSFASAGFDLKGFSAGLRHVF
jgi:predicted porin